MMVPSDGAEVIGTSRQPLPLEYTNLTTVRRKLITQLQQHDDTVCE